LVVSEGTSSAQRRYCLPRQGIAIKVKAASDSWRSNYPINIKALTFMEWLNRLGPAIDLEGSVGGFSRPTLACIGLLRDQVT
jgi:hypothetical protein